MNQDTSQLKFPAQIDVANEQIQYIEITKNQLDALAFHDKRLNQGKTAVLINSISNIKNSMDNSSLSFIFHTAFCGSTYLSKLLGQKFFSIREPNIFMNLANLKRVNPRFNNDPQLFNSWVAKTLSSFNDQLGLNGKLLFKPSNSTNNIISNLLDASSQGKALLLYTNLDDFLVSILKKGEAGKSFIRNLYNIFSLDKSPFAMTDFRKVNCFTDLQIACLVWCMQMHVYQQIAYSDYGGRIKFLHANTLLNDPKLAISKISYFFDNQLNVSDIEKLEELGLFSSHSKHSNQDYNTEIRKQENRQIKDKYRREFEEINQWVNNSLKPPSIPSQKLHLELE
jgi:hypothetical protein